MSSPVKVQTFLSSPQWFGDCSDRSPGEWYTMCNLAYIYIYLYIYIFKIYFIYTYALYIYIYTF